jgi:hypothetical protein
LSTTFFEIWHLAMLTFAWRDLGQDFITHCDGLADRVNPSITCQTLDMTTHVFGDHCDDRSLSTCTRSAA